VLVDMPGSGQSGVVVVAPFAALGAADRRVGEVAHAVLGGGYSARLNQQVRIRRGLSYGASASAEPQPGGGMWTAQAQTQHATALEVLQLLREETLRLAQQPPGAAELAARQAALIGSFARRLETTAGLAAALGNQLAQGRPLAELSRYVDEVKAVTPQQVSDFAARHWRPDALRAVVAGDLQAAGPALRESDPGALVRPLAGLDLERADLVR
jgi:zinc protease